MEFVACSGKILRRQLKVGAGADRKSEFELPGRSGSHVMYLFLRDRFQSQAVLYNLTLRNDRPKNSEVIGTYQIEPLRYLVDDTVEIRLGSCSAKELKQGKKSRTGSLDFLFFRSLELRKSPSLKDGRGGTVTASRVPRG